MSSDWRWRFLCFVLLIVPPTLMTPGCSRGPQRPFEFVAVVPFEDLSPAGTGLIGRAVIGLAADLAQGDRRIRVGMVQSVRDAHLLNATRTVTGWYQVTNGVVAMHGTVRDEATSRVRRSFDLTASESELPRLASSLASETEAPLYQGPLPKSEALLSYARASTRTTPLDAFADLDQALRADPGYGSAWVRRIELLLRAGSREQTAAAIESAKAARLTPADQARLDLASAQFSDSGPAKTEALKRLAAVETVNPQILNTLVDLQMQQRDFRGAIAASNQLLELNPGSEDALNRRAYAYAFAGDLPGARKAFEEYRARRPDSVNAVDSLGDVLFYFRRYDEAAGLFLEAHKKNPALLAGAELFRAALSYALAGNLKEADAKMAQFFQLRKSDPLLPLRKAIWARMTGRPAEFPLPKTAAGLATAAMYASRDGDRTGAAALAAEARKMVTSPAEASLASAAALISQASAPVDTWLARIQSAAPDPRQQGIRTELAGWALLLDNHPLEAAKVWRDAFDQTSPLSNNDTRVLLFWSLAEGGRKDEALKVMPDGWLPPVSLEPGLGVLFYPKVHELRTKL